MGRRYVTAAIAATLISAGAWAGTIYSAKTTTEGGRGGAAQNSTVKSYISGDSVKVEFVESGNPMMAKGGYLVSRDGGTSMFLVSPKDKTYMKWDMDSMMNMAGGAMKMMNMKLSDAKFEKISEEPNGLIAGVPTIHYKYHSSYTMTMSFMGMNIKSRITADDEVWAAPKLLEMALGVWLRKAPPKLGDEGFDTLVKNEMSKMQGFPLKKRTVTTSTDDKGKTETTTTTMEVTSFETGASVPDSTFEIPAGYKETSMTGGDENPFAKMQGGKSKQ